MRACVRNCMCVKAFCVHMHQTACVYLNMHTCLCGVYFTHGQSVPVAAMFISAILGHNTAVLESYRQTQVFQCYVLAHQCTSCSPLLLCGVTVESV